VGPRRQLDLRLVAVDGSKRYGVDVALADLVEAAMAHHTHQPGQRLALGGIVASGAMPDADVGFLQDFLGGAAIAQDAQRDGEELRRGPAIELGESRLVGERDARKQRGQQSRTIGGRG
jgi:hypothetical protein